MATVYWNLMCLECRLHNATDQVLTLLGIRSLTWLLMTYAVEMESYVVFIVMWFCKFLRNCILKTRVVMAYSARDPCTTSWHTTQCISTCANVIMVPVSLFSAVTMSETQWIHWIKQTTSLLWLVSLFFASYTPPQTGIVWILFYPTSDLSDKLWRHRWCRINQSPV